MNVKKAKLRKKSKRLATTLVLFSIATLLILNLVSAVCIGTLTSSGMNQKQDAFLQQTTLSGKRQVEQFIEQYIGITETLAQSTQLPVSYTHLVPQLSQLMRKRTISENLSAVAMLTQSRKPVSYTHLDVYKRQSPAL